MQTIRPGESFLPDDHYEMVVAHDWPGEFDVEGRDNDIVFATRQLKVVVDKETLAAKFFLIDVTAPVLKEKSGVTWNGTQIAANFVADPSEHFSGLGHGYFAREDSIDLRGKIVQSPGNWLKK